MVDPKIPVNREAARYYESIDSHFSLGQNMINFRIANALSERSLTAKDEPTIPNLKAYFNAIDEFYEAFNFILPKDRVIDFEEKREMFLQHYYAVCDGKLPLTERTALKLLFMLKNMRFILTKALQGTFSYFYRMSKRQKRGLNNLDYLFQDNIFK